MADKDATIHFRLSRDLREALETLAERDDRKLSPYIERVLRLHAERELAKSKRSR